MNIQKKPTCRAGGLSKETKIGLGVDFLFGLRLAVDDPFYAV